MTREKTVVTSWREDQYKEYGANFLKTFEEYWPTDVQRIFYYEDLIPTWLPETWRALDLRQLDKWANFARKLQFPIMRGVIDPSHKSMNFDAMMCRKVYMEMSITEGKVFWIDGDVMTHSFVTHEFLDDVLPNDKLCCFLGRDERPMGYTESGFIGFNTDHPTYESFSGTYTGYVDAGLNFTNPGWHDCYAFDAVRRTFNSEAFNDLGKDVPHEGHVFVNSVLGSVMDHLKGPRKEAGKSQSDDLLIERHEEYWNEKAHEGS